MRTSNCRRKLFISFSVLFGIISVWFVFANREAVYTELMPVYKHIPDTAEAKDVMKTVERAYKIESKAARTFDLSEFSTVFINDSRFPMDQATLQVVREMTGNLSLEWAGYLDYKMAYYTWWGEGAIRLETLKAKAKAENRKLTKEELQSLTDAYGRSAAPRLEGEPKDSVRFISVDVNGDLAYAVIEYGAWTSELTLVLVNEDWHIADIKGLAFRP
jgi:hypothetical protein